MECARKLIAYPVTNGIICPSFRSNVLLMKLIVVLFDKKLRPKSPFVSIENLTVLGEILRSRPTSLALPYPVYILIPLGFRLILLFCLYLFYGILHSTNLFLTNTGLLRNRKRRKIHHVYFRPHTRLLVPKFLPPPVNKILQYS